MDRLTPELHLHSSFDGDSTTTILNEFRALDFNLARRSAVVINSITGQIQHAPDTTTGFETGAVLIQELDLDPDNQELEFANNPNPQGVVIDSSRVFRQVYRNLADTAAGLGHTPHSVLQKDWRHVPPNERPISLTNLTHVMGHVAEISYTFWCEINIDYFIVELSLLEIGILNASRR